MRVIITVIIMKIFIQKKINIEIEISVKII